LRSVEIEGSELEGEATEELEHFEALDDEELKTPSNIIYKIQISFKMLRTKKQTMILRRKTDLAPLKINETRWSGKHGIFKLYFELKLKPYLNS
jgi:hypothetical protein